MLLALLTAFPTYFMMSMGTGADPISAGFCAWLGICVAQGVVRGVPAGADDARPPPIVNKCASSVPQRFRALGDRTVACEAQEVNLNASLKLA